MYVITTPKTIDTDIGSFYSESVMDSPEVYIDQEETIDQKKNVKPVEMSQQEREYCNSVCYCNLLPNGDKLECNKTEVGGIIRTLEMKKYSNYICAQNFRNIADNIFFWYDWQFGEKTTSPPFFLQTSCFMPYNIVYLNGWHFKDFFDVLYDGIPYEFLLITGASINVSPPPTTIVFLFTDLGYLEE